MFGELEKIVFMEAFILKILCLSSKIIIFLIDKKVYILKGGIKRATQIVQKIYTEGQKAQPKKNEELQKTRGATKNTTCP